MNSPSLSPIHHGLMQFQTVPWGKLMNGAVTTQRRGPQVVTAANVAQCPWITTDFRRSQKCGIKCEISHIKYWQPMQTFLEHCAGHTKQPQLPRPARPANLRVTSDLASVVPGTGTALLCLYFSWVSL